MDTENGTDTRAARDTMRRKAVCSWFVPKRFTIAGVMLAIIIAVGTNAVGQSLNFRAGVRIDIVVTAGVSHTNVAAIGRIAATPLKAAVAA